MSGAGVYEEADVVVVVVGGGPGYKKRSTEFSNAVNKVIANKERDMVPSLRSPVVLHALQEGVKEQARVMLGEHAVPEFPIFEGGLVPSETACPALCLCDAR